MKRAGAAPAGLSYTSTTQERHAALLRQAAAEGTAAPPGDKTPPAPVPALPPRFRTAIQALLVLAAGAVAPAREDRSRPRAPVYSLLGETEIRQFDPGKPMDSPPAVEQSPEKIHPRG